MGIERVDLARVSEARGSSAMVGERRRGAPRVFAFERGFVVGGTGLEPVTSAMSTLRSSQLS